MFLCFWVNFNSFFWPQHIQNKYLGSINYAWILKIFLIAIFLELSWYCLLEIFFPYIIEKWRVNSEELQQKGPYASELLVCMCPLMLWEGISECPPSMTGLDSQHWNNSIISCAEKIFQFQEKVRFSLSKYHHRLYRVKYYLPIG